MAILLGFSAQEARAGLVTWEILGETTVVIESGINSGFADLVRPGSPFRVEVTFDPNTPDLDADPLRGAYVGAIVQMSGIIGELSFSGTGLSNIIGAGARDAPINDAWNLTIQDIFISSIDDYATLDLFLYGTTGGVFLDDSLPVVVPDLARFENAGFNLETQRGAESGFGDITAIVPEPHTLYLVGISAAYVFKRRRASTVLV